MDETHLCVCCLRCPPHKDLTTPYADHDDKTEIYSDMLQDCFNIQMVLDGWDSCGICTECAGRLRDASDFKLQVQRCQAELRARTPARSRVKEEELDMELPVDHEEETGYERVLQELLGPGLADGAGANDDEEEPDTELPVEHEEETGYEHVLQELPGPGLADGAGASDDEESTVKQVVITVDEGELYGVRQAGSSEGNKEQRSKYRLRPIRDPPHGYIDTPIAQVHYNCNNCGKAFKSKSGLKKHFHLSTESSTGLKTCPALNVFSCKHCSYTCRYKANLQLHEMKHTGEKPYKCSNCDYTSRAKTDLQRHQMIHTGEKPFKCSSCEYTCRLRSYLNKHEMIHTGEKPFACSYCDYKCRLKSDLQKHQRTHTGEKPFQCSNCKYECRLKTDLQRHQMIHTGEKPFQCSECNYTCRLKTDLHRHHMIHTGEKPFECSHCNYKCRLKTDLQKHQRIHTV